MFKRIISVLAVTALLVAMLLATAMPAFALGQNETAPNCEQGNDTAYAEEGGLHHRDVHATDSLDKNYYGGIYKPNGAFCLQ